MKGNNTTGECLCGAVQFSIEGVVPNLYQCHCSQCRKQGGSASNTATIVHEQQFSWTSGDNLVNQYKDRTGFNSHFCSVCGSPVPNRLGNQALIWIPAGLLNDSSDLEVTVHLYTASRAHWDNIQGSAHQYNEMPDLEALTRVLQRTSN